jgi:hypothetical protein
MFVVSVPPEPSHWPAVHGSRMDHIERPSLDAWDQRRAWFELAEEVARGRGSFLPREQACALVADVQASFCGGAWAAVVILAMAVVETSVREVEVPGFSGNTRDLIAAAAANRELQVPRARRTALVHVRPETQALTIENPRSDRTNLEVEARSAARLMFEAFYFSSGT